ncbi:MAG: tRNA dimethylallyltransferase [Candidatus Westeberhardia cardiocondylae]|nr:tRNA dimethylallyltransferase [Candidatus Westeberhardia cardiocondylae]
MVSYLKIIFLIGPTSSGKTDLSVLLGRRLPIEIISVDSAMVYRGMDIGTAKPSYKDLLDIPHRLINICDPIDSYSVFEFYKDSVKAIHDIIKRGRIPMLVGGSMFYFKSLFSGGFSVLPSNNKEIRLYISNKANKIGWKKMYQKLKKIDFTSACRIHPNDIQRISRALEVFFVSGKTITELSKNFLKNSIFDKYKTYKFIVFPYNKSLLHKRIERRFYDMLSLGFENEVRLLFSRGDLTENMPSMKCIGYRQMLLYITGSINYNDMINRAIFATKNLAKRQITWIKKWNNFYCLDSENIFESLDKVLRIVL